MKKLHCWSLFSYPINEAPTAQLLQLVQERRRPGGGRVVDGGWTNEKPIWDQRLDAVDQSAATSNFIREQISFEFTTNIGENYLFFY